MRLANLDGRAVLADGEGTLDVETASAGRFGSDPMALYPRWAEFAAWAGSLGRAWDEAHDPLTLHGPMGLDRFGPPVPRPGQIFAVGLNYRPHAAEAGFRPPDEPLVFTKFASCITGPSTAIPLPPGHVDWELELVVAIGAGGHRVPVGKAWDAVAGLTVGQDLSERLVQSRGAPAQFSLGKSFPGFGPIGPWLVTPDELDDPDDLELVCTLSGEEVQRERTSNMIFSVSELIARISAVCPLLPGDLIFTGTPGGVGNRRVPPRFLTVDDELSSRIEGIGQMLHRFMPAAGSTSGSHRTRLDEEPTCQH